jgi:uncharacterized membrane protein
MSAIPTFLHLRPVDPLYRTENGSSRLQSLDVMRGVVMVLMAIDHVRVYSGVPAGGPSAGVFFTRWVTHFCAPAFVFFAGTSAFLSRRKPRTDMSGSVEQYLVTRGLILVLLELTVIRIAWTFNLDFANYILAGVIWMIGWCLILLALMVRLPIGIVATIGAAIVAGHNLVDARLQQLIPAAQASNLFWLWRILYFGPIAATVRSSCSTRSFRGLASWRSAMPSVPS